MSGDVICLKTIAPDGSGECVDCSYVLLPNKNGSLGILANHAPMLCALENGEITCRKQNGEEKKISVPGGVAEIYKNKITVLLI